MIHAVIPVCVHTISKVSLGGISFIIVILYVLVLIWNHFDLDYTLQKNVRTVVETIMIARRMHRNQMHAHFKKFQSKEAALLKSYLDTMEKQWKELCVLFTNDLREQNKKNRSKLTVNHAAGSRSFQRTRACMLAKARDEIEAMRAAREKDLQEFAKKQAEMEPMLRDQCEEQQVDRNASSWSMRSA
ncbi:hypothetical protein CJ030_MR2G023039 [Morella rubra]|uniref:Uncharacterized protein n=1 Tax=Morella rubra TaxID=262757 RepID=A0A6A1WEF4_9ROSI|nr:hypothetical protein CJ030_MR2G023039 [Morella rubra]